ncbi:GNAT family N-acetyltransferase [uncultured Lutibacter sp.]|uniref:GNAT family N-acetyltransferase n=1 Tax=uncultured Lutibacter sp. TaxID=437739 RepID=UPI0026355646|nr:GNAT family N-acetyltransferase [uncultured Lutibacter sp.]
MNFRNQLIESDIKAVKEILNSTGFFYDFEVDVAVELAEENLEKGEEKSGYFFTIAEVEGKAIAFSCYGKTPCTAASFDLYWIAVHQNHKGKGIGKKLLKMLEIHVAKLNGKNIWIETAGRPLYSPTRKFYEKYGCDLVAELPEFYGENDSKVIYLLKV